jgi:LacI family repressor for deo operon, udp, cdd, tsx, nupC, and nupG
VVSGEDYSANCRDRRRGYEDALRLWDIPTNPDWLIPAGGSMELSPEARNRLVDLLLSRQGPTAVFCAGYYLALEVIDVARQLDVALPAHLSLVAVDDPKSAQYLNPPLTTLCQPLAEIGARGAARLLTLMRDGAPDIPLAEQLPAELVLRGSCAAPREMRFPVSLADMP